MLVVVYPHYYGRGVLVLLFFYLGCFGCCLYCRVDCFVCLVLLTALGVYCLYLLVVCC